MIGRNEPPQVQRALNATESSISVEVVVLDALSQRRLVALISLSSTFSFHVEDARACTGCW